MLKNMPKYRINPNPCETCPYRKDTPSGIWAAEEYRKLPQYDIQFAMPGTFLCHNGAPKPEDNRTLCRGWVEVHDQNLNVRLACAQTEWTEESLKPTKVPLYKSGEEAARAGMRRIKNPSVAARLKVIKLKRRSTFKTG